MVLHWEPHGAYDTHMPKRALVGGKEDTGEPIYVGRAKHLDFYLPAKIIPDKKLCYISFGGEEVLVKDFEILTGDHHKFTWEPRSYGAIHPDAVSTGKVNEETVYIGRTVFNGSMVVGRVSELQKCIFIAFDGQEHSLQHYEILTYHPRRNSFSNVGMVW